MVRKQGKQRGPNEVDEEIGRRLRLLRLDRKISQIELGFLLGLTFQQIQKYEKGVNRVSASRLMEIAEKLQTTPHHLMGWTGNGHDGVATPLLQADDHRLLRDYEKIASHVKPVLRVLINKLASERN